MNVGGESANGRSQDFDLNLAPIIDCFTVLITFMLASASFLAIGVFDTAASTPAPSTSNTQPPPITLEVELTLQKELRLKVNGKAKIDRVIAARNNDYDPQSLITELKALLTKYPGVSQITLTPENDVEYLYLIRMMESLKPHITTTLLGGF